MEAEKKNLLTLPEYDLTRFRSKDDIFLEKPIRALKAASLIWFANWQLQSGVGNVHDRRISFAIKKRALSYELLDRYVRHRQISHIELLCYQTGMSVLFKYKPDYKPDNLHLQTSIIELDFI